MANGSVQQLLLTSYLFGQRLIILVSPVRSDSPTKPHRQPDAGNRLGKYPAQDYNPTVMNQLPAILQQSALAWATAYYQTDKIVVVIIREEDDEPDRYLALIAAANQSGWQAAEVWLEDGSVATINDLGEGLPPDDLAWPW